MTLDPPPASTAASADRESHQPGVEQAVAGGAHGAAPRDAEFVEDPRFRMMRRLVNLLLIVMIGGFLTIVVALVLKLRDAPAIGVVPLAPSERIVEADAGNDRVTLTLHDEATGRDRVVVLDGASFKPIAVLEARPSE